MGRAIKAALLSALVFPGCGHFFLKKYVKGTVLASITFAGIYFIIKIVWGKAQQIVDRIQNGEVDPDFGSIQALVSEQSAGAVSQLPEVMILMLLSAWVFGIVDSYRLGRIRNESAPERRKQSSSRRAKGRQVSKKAFIQKPFKIEDSVKHVNDLLEYGGEFALIVEQENAIKQVLTKKNLTYDSPSEKDLIWQLAACQVMNWVQQIKENILDSQLALLKLAASSNEGLTQGKISSLFYQAQQDNMEVLGEWHLLQYLNYLLESNLMEKIEYKYIATQKGKEFLKILSNTENLNA